MQSPPDLDAQQLRERYAQFCSRALTLDMTRGKPSAAQLDLSNALLSLPGDDFCDAHGIDARNYGGLDGLAAMRELFGAILGVAADCVVVGGNSSLTMMYDVVARACQFGTVEGVGAWNELPRRKFLCPSPGYDRHFAITEHLGFELIAVDIDDAGPNMTQVEKLVARDSSIKGIWCVPKYSNPTGACYDFDTVARLANMQCAAPDFRIMWDNAYAEHHLDDAQPPLENIDAHCRAAGCANRAIQFASTSKMTHPGSGVAAMASSEANIADARAHIEAQSIGPDKVNQLRTLKFFGDLTGVRAHMKKHAAIIKPKFDATLEVLARELTGWATWSAPHGGYFINLDIADGCAKRAVQLARDAGVTLTAAGAPFPRGIDPRDRNIRIAPTFPPLDDVICASEVLAVCAKLAMCERDSPPA